VGCWTFCLGLAWAWWLGPVGGSDVDEGRPAVGNYLGVQG
jgi:hypothetical protein